MKANNIAITIDIIKNVRYSKPDFKNTELKRGRSYANCNGESS
jgi:hypothetical protein